MFLWLKPLEISLPLAAGSSSEASLSEQEAEGNSVSGPLDVWSIRLMNGQLVTGTDSYTEERDVQHIFFLFFFLEGAES